MAISASVRIFSYVSLLLFVDILVYYSAGISLYKWIKVADIVLDVKVDNLAGAAVDRVNVIAVDKRLWNALNTVIPRFIYTNRAD